VTKFTGREGAADYDPVEAVKPDLAIQLVQRNYDEYAANSQALIESLTGQLAEARAETECIRNSVEMLLVQRYAPSEHMIRQSLYPDKAYIKSFIPEEKS
jgi:hypothetical protein